MGACRPAQKGPADHGRYAISRGLEVLEDEWKVGAPCNCADTVYFMDIKPGGQSHSLLCYVATWGVYHSPTVHTWVQVSHISSPYLVGLEGMVS